MTNEGYRIISLEDRLEREQKDHNLAKTKLETQRNEIASLKDELDRYMYKRKQDRCNFSVDEMLDYILNKQEQIMFKEVIEEDTVSIRTLMGATVTYIRRA